MSGTTVTWDGLAWRGSRRAVESPGCVRLKMSFFLCGAWFGGKAALSARLSRVLLPRERVERRHTEEDEQHK